MAFDRDTKRKLSALLKGKVMFDEPMAAHTYIGVGGPADALAAPENPRELADLLEHCAKTQLAYRIIGGGTNLLVRDIGIRGVVIRIDRGFDAIQLHGSRDGDTFVTAMAGAKMQALCRFANANGLAGMNAMVGIPGTVGGGLMMNAGTALGSMADIVASVSIMEGSGQVRTIERNRLAFVYRELSFTGPIAGEPDRPPIIIEGRLRLQAAAPEVLKAEARTLRDKRHKTQPVAEPSAGCFFKNPAGDKTAGELIDLAGLKGQTIGGAQISKKHANYIVNRGNATAAHIIALRDVIRNAVAKKFNVELETEVKIVGP